MDGAIFHRPHIYIQEKMIKEKTKNILRYQLVYLLLIIALVVAIIVNINTGNVHVTVGKIFRIIFLGDFAETTEYAIIWKIRLPRIVTALLLGGALGVSGFLIQTFFRNPIASPFILGISSGARMLVAVAVVFFTSVSAFGMILVSFFGSIIAMMFVLFVSQKVKSMPMLLVVGIMIGYICSAITNVIIIFADDADLAHLTNWTLGTFSSATWENVFIITIVVIVGVVLSIFASKPISAYQLGEGYALSMGVNIKRVRTIIILLTSLLSACVTAFAGPISFVGIAVPHVTKLMLKTSKPLTVLPATFLFGGVFCLICDLIARTALSPNDIAISTVTAIFGAPIVITMLINRKRGGVQQ